jgi:hypothetical protein
MIFYLKSGGDVISPYQGILLPEKIPWVYKLGLTYIVKKDLVI